MKPETKKILPIIAVLFIVFNFVIPLIGSLAAVTIVSKQETANTGASQQKANTETTDTTGLATAVTGITGLTIYSRNDSTGYEYAVYDPSGILKTPKNDLSYAEDFVTHCSVLVMVGTDETLQDGTLDKLTQVVFGNDRNGFVICLNETSRKKTRRVDPSISACGEALDTLGQLDKSDSYKAKEVLSSIAYNASASSDSDEAVTYISKLLFEDTYQIKVDRKERAEKQARTYVSSIILAAVIALTMSTLNVFIVIYMKYRKIMNIGMRTDHYRMPRSLKDDEVNIKIS